MSAPSTAPPKAPPQFHPEFGYFWPAPQFRRIVRVAAICTICGAVVGAVAVLAEIPIPASDQDKLAGGAQTDSSAPPTTVGIGGSVKPASGSKVAPMATDKAGELTASTCGQQTWPYLDDKCLSGSDAAGAGGKDIRVLRPDEPAESARAIVMPGPSDKDVMKAKAQAQAEAQAKPAKKEKKHARAKRVRQRVSPDAYEAYASPYRGRYRSRGREWGWGAW